ncbi:DUF4132 domain-containing protein [Nocardia sp. NBC_00881]|uniref:DUF4132 domain-containing protein n=1 Tax=Nocardia sp. NBC_00881 TaxID=2975995 RepID=UPI00386D4C0D|nr:DUF4132 domain-containing protein [Nocardia sp. NBC_00881]
MSIWSNSFFDPLLFAWLISLLPADPRTARALRRLAEACLYKVSGNAPLDPKVANAAVIGLGRIDSEAAVAELARLSTRVTYRGTLALVKEALDTRADALGITRAEIEEMTVPHYGLSEAGRAAYKLGEATAIVEIEGTHAVLRWQNAAGNMVKSAPAAVGRDCAGELKELRTTVKDIDTMLTSQRTRLERLFLAPRTWTFDVWRELYLDHPLVGALARRLLWDIDGTTIGYADGQLRTVLGDPITDGSQVRLWHPIGRANEEILAWRARLDSLGITQSFEQAHREVYRLTDAERRTASHSNRFAAHILRQHQFHALATLHGWRNKLRLPVDDEAPPATRELPEWGLRAEYWIEGRDDEEEDDTGSPSYRYVYGDQIRFYPIDAPVVTAHMSDGDYGMRLRAGVVPVEPVPLETVPPLVLSEIFRDVALFVGVSTVGNDPTRVDGPRSTSQRVPAKPYECQRS